MWCLQNNLSPKEIDNLFEKFSDNKQNEAKEEGNQSKTMMRDVSVAPP